MLATIAHVINLDHRKDRYEKITDMCKNLKSIHLEKFNALYGDPGWKYCGLSHLEVIKQNIDKGKHILVFEDDCCILVPKQFDARWNEIKKWLDDNPDKWDIFNGGRHT